MLWLNFMRINFAVLRLLSKQSPNPSIASPVYLQRQQTPNPLAQDPEAVPPVKKTNKDQHRHPNINQGSFSWPTKLDPTQGGAVVARVAGPVRPGCRHAPVVLERDNREQGQDWGQFKV